MRRATRYFGRTHGLDTKTLWQVLGDKGMNVGPLIFRQFLLDCKEKIAESKQRTFLKKPCCIIDFHGSPFRPAASRHQSRIPLFSSGWERRDVSPAERRTLQLRRVSPHPTSEIPQGCSGGRGEINLFVPRFVPRTARTFLVAIPAEVGIELKSCAEAHRVDCHRKSSGFP